MKTHTNNYKFKTQKPTKSDDTNFVEQEYGEQTKKWYQEIPDDPENFPKVSDEKLIELKDEAKKCNDAEIATYNIKNSKTNSEYQWMKTVMARGTIADKIAAFTLLIQDDPVCNLPTIHNLINMVKMGKAKECVSVIGTLAELFLSDLLRPNVKLKSFYQRPLSKLDELTSGNATTKRKYLSIWYFEDQLKEYYTTFVQALNTAAQDTIDANKEKAITAMCKLLIGNPEQEKNLLSNLVNKLGDPSQKIASKTIYCLAQVLYEHPAMKQVVLNEIERLLFRPNIAIKAQYYAICFLNQFVLSHDDYEVAKNLISVYFAFFKACIKKEEIDSRMMSALLMGVNRAYPYAQSELEKIAEHIDTMYKVVHVATFNVSIHALNLLYQISNHNDSLKNRFYSALYKKLLDSQIGASKHQALFLSLIFRAVKKDTSVGRVRAFIKRLLQLALYMQPAMACGILFLIHNLMRGNKNLLAIKFRDGSVFENDSGAEKYEDIKVEEEPENQNTETTNPENSNIELQDPKTDLKGSWNHSNITIKSEYDHPAITEFNPMQRNPLYTGGEFCVYFELLDLQKHFHPTVSLYAKKILNAENIMYSGDPLKDFTLIKFLERFSFRNPKKAEDLEKKGVNPVFAKRQLQVPTGIKSFATNSKNYLNSDQKKIPVEELFMYTYLQKKQRVEKMEEEDNDSDLESVASDEFEEMLNRMSGNKNRDEELDFMNDIGESLKVQQKGKKKTGKSDEESDEDDDSDIEDDDEMEFSGDDDIEDDDFKGVENNMEGFEDRADDDDDFDFEDDESDFGDDLELSDDEDLKSNKNNKKKMKNTKKKGGIPSAFASADEFADLLDQDPDFMAGSSQAMSNRDNANVKQLNWELNRHRWIKGYNNAIGKGNKSNKMNNNAIGKGSKNNKMNNNTIRKGNQNNKTNKKQFGNKRRKQQKTGPKNKKQKK